MVPADALRIVGTHPQSPTVMVAELNCRTEAGLQQVPKDLFAREYEEKQTLVADPEAALNQMKAMANDPERFNELVGGSPTMAQFLAGAAAKPQFAQLTLSFGIHKASVAVTPISQLPTASQAGELCSEMMGYLLSVDSVCRDAQAEGVV